MNQHVDVLTPWLGLSRDRSGKCDAVKYDHRKRIQEENKQLNQNSAVIGSNGNSERNSRISIQLSSVGIIRY